MSYATPARPIVGDKRVQRALERQEERGKEPDVTRILARHLAADRGLSAQVVNKFNDGKYPTGRYGWMHGEDGGFDDRYGPGSNANIAGLKGVELGKGDVYMGATAIETPRVTRQTPYAGESVIEPASTRYDITVLPRWMVKPQQRGSSASTAAAETSTASTAVPPDLTKAREAYDRAGEYKNQSSGLNLALSGPSLYQNIHDAGAGGVEAYERRFIPELMANANLTAQEIRYGASNALDSLPDNLKLPTHDKIFPKQATNKQGLYRWLEQRLA